MTPRQEKLLEYFMELINAGVLQKGRRYAGIEILVPFAEDFEAIADVIAASSDWVCACETWNPSGQELCSNCGGFSPHTGP